MLAKLKIRSRVLLLALVATLALAGSSGLVSEQLLSGTVEVGADAALAELAQVNRAAVDAAVDLQAESDAELLLLTAMAGPAADDDLAARREATNASLTRLGDAIAAVGGSRATRLADAAAALSTVFDHREAVDLRTATVADVEAFQAATRVGLGELQGVSGAVAGEIAAEESGLTVSGMDVNLLAGAAGGLLVLLMALAVSRSITRPLRLLTEAAERGAKLPALVEALRRPTGQDKHLALAPVGLPPQGEIGRAAKAFDSFQGAAAKLAVSHASMLNRSVAEKGTAEVFVNLARRMQSLVDHQIEFLDSLEAGEEDPDSLEDLFRLDQLATRVRRNAESLLSLAGSAAVRSWERPLSMADVIRAGAAEVEDLGRIDVSVRDHFTMLGNVAADAAHLLSELLENATRWSPPSTRVEVMGRPAPGGYEILVQDHGVGMTPQALAEANHVLTGPPVAGPTVARSLGLVVAGRLARRLGIEVRLSSAAPSGVTARVFVPSTLIVSTEADAAELEEAAGGRAVPFALARQEKRARISSHRTRGPRGPRPAPPADPAPDLPVVEDRSARIIPLGDAPRRTVDPTGPQPSRTPAPPAPVEPAPPAAPAAPAARAGDDLRMPDLPARRPSWSPPPAAGTPAPPAPAPAAPPPAPAPAPAPAPTSMWASPAPPAPPAPAAPPVNGAVAPAGDATPAAPPEKADQYQQLLEKAAAAGLVRRVPKASLPADAGATPRPGPAEQPSGGPRVPDDVRNLLSSYRTGVSRGRADEPVPAPRAAVPLRPSPLDALPPLKARVRSQPPAGDQADPGPDPVAAAGLVRRVPKASLPPDTGVRAAEPSPGAEDAPGASHRLPEDVRNLLSSYRSGVRRGRLDQAEELSPSHDQPHPYDQPHPSPQEWS